eukprot:630122-Pelagomonas_calceolata.AAC.1
MVGLVGWGGSASSSSDEKTRAKLRWKLAAAASAIVVRLGTGGQEPVHDPTEELRLAGAPVCRGGCCYCCCLSRQEVPVLLSQDALDDLNDRLVKAKLVGLCVTAPPLQVLAEQWLDGFSRRLPGCQLAGCFC